VEAIVIRIDISIWLIQCCHELSSFSRSFLVEEFRQNPAKTATLGNSYVEERFTFLERCDKLDATVRLANRVIWRDLCSQGPPLRRSLSGASTTIAADISSITTTMMETTTTTMDATSTIITIRAPCRYRWSSYGSAVQCMQGILAAATKNYIFCFHAIARDVASPKLSLLPCLVNRHNLFRIILRYKCGGQITRLWHERSSPERGPQS
jgi:hypothetical protein